MVQVNVIDTRDDVSDDVCFDTRRLHGDASEHTPWDEKSNSITLSGKAIKDLGVDGS